MKAIVIVPARMGSTRLAKKPLLRLDGVSMIRRTVDKVLESGLSPIVVATDSEDIMKECSGIEGVVPVMTAEDHVCGTDRVLEAYQKVSADMGDFDIVINVQGDEPFLNPDLLKGVMEKLPERKHASFWTTVTDLPEHERKDENVAKVVTAINDDALIFTRSDIPDSYKHTSVYVYTPGFLNQFCSLPPSPLETSYRLEQMRALDNGLTLNCIYLPFDSVSINTLEDIDKAGVKDFEFHQ